MTIDSDVTNELFLVNAARVYTYVIENSGLDDLTVYEVNAAGLQTIVINYNNVLDGTGPPLWDGGTITFSSAHRADTVSVEVQRTTTITQLINYQAYDAFPAETHEFGLDKLTMITQESRALIDWLLGDPFGGSGGIPIISPFIPLAGTQVTRPITGTLVFDHNDTGPSWSQFQTDLYGINAMAFNGSGVDSEFFITTVDSLGNGNQFRFTKDGELSIPSSLAGNNESWVIKGVDFLGTENALSIFSFNNDTNLRTSNPIILYSSDVEFFYHGEDGKILTSGVVLAGDNDQILTTKIYVDTVVAGIGLPSEVAGNMLVGTGAGWGVAAGITLDTVTTPGQADMTLGGKFILANTHASHLLESWETSTGDILGVNWMKITPSTAAGALSIYTDSALTENFGFAGGFLSLPRLPTSSSHAASKQYVDARLPTGTLTNDVLRWNGSDWVGTSAVSIDAAGLATFSQTADFSGITVGSPSSSVGGNTDLVVGGTIAVEGMASSAGTDVVSVFGVLALKSSDESLKKNISPTRYGLKEVMLLEPSDFQWIGEGGDDTGFIAQAVQKIIPEATPQNPDGLLGFRDLPVLAALTKAIQEMSAKVDALEAKVIAMGGDV